MSDEIDNTLQPDNLNSKKNDKFNKKLKVISIKKNFQKTEVEKGPKLYKC
jgi:hypothetical protein